MALSIQMAKFKYQLRAILKNLMLAKVAHCNMVYGSPSLCIRDPSSGKITVVY